MQRLICLRSYLLVSMIVDSLNRDIRNSASHLNMRYSIKDETFLLKVKNGKKYQVKTISAEKFIFEIFPMIGCLIQAFIYSCALLVLAGMDKTQYYKSVNTIYKI